jgi:hypothetical protein
MKVEVAMSTDTIQHEQTDDRVPTQREPETEQDGRDEGRRGPSDARDEDQGEGRDNAAPDVYLHVPVLEVDEIDLEVEDLRAHVSLQAEVLDLVKLNVGVDASLGHVHLGIRGVKAQATLKVRLDNVAGIVDRVLDTIDRNPQILEHVTRGLGQATQEVGSGAGRAVEQVGQGASDAVSEVGSGAATAAGELGRGAGEAVSDLGQGASGAVSRVGEGAGQAVSEVGEGASGAVSDVGQGAGDTVSEVGDTVSDVGDRASEPAGGDGIEAASDIDAGISTEDDEPTDKAEDTAEAEDADAEDADPDEGPVADAEDLEDEDVDGQTEEAEAKPQDDTQAESDEDSQAESDEADAPDQERVPVRRTRSGRKRAEERTPAGERREPRARQARRQEPEGRRTRQPEPDDRRATGRQRSGESK